MWRWVALEKLLFENFDIRFAYKHIFCQISFNPIDVQVEAAISIEEQFVDVITASFAAHPPSRPRVSFTVRLK